MREAEFRRSAVLKCLGENGLEMLPLVVGGAGILESADLRMLAQAAKGERSTTSMEATQENIAVARHHLFDGILFAVDHRGGCGAILRCGLSRDIRVGGGQDDRIPIEWAVKVTSTFRLSG